MRRTMTRHLIANLLLAMPLLAHAAVTEVAGEASRTPAQTAPAWRLAQFPARTATPVAYRELALQRLVQLQERNASMGIKATQIGIGRQLAGEGIGRTTPALRWVPLASGGAVARLQVSSPDALGLRVGLQVSGLHPHVELRFGGSDAPSRVVAAVTAAEARQSADAQGIYWGPATDGAIQSIEVYRPAHVSAAQARLQAPQASHLLANSRNDFKIVEKVGESASCNIDAVCRVASLGPAYVQAKNAVAHMLFNLYTTSGSVYGTYICTGTLLNDTTPGTQVPWFYTADHCFAGGSNGVPAQNRAQVALSLNTYWGYENSTCGSNNAVRANPLVGGADLMFYDPDVDAMLLRLRSAPPASATFVGWDASPLAANASVVALHHPSGDAKKYSRGQHLTDVYAENYTVGWQEGTTEGGSSGSGLFTLYGDDSYRLRGGLYGGSASCANSGNLSTAANRDHYSRLDLVFPQIKQWIAADAVRENGSQPRVRSTGSAVTQSQGARTSAPAVSAASPATAPASRDRQRPATPLRAGTLER